MARGVRWEWETDSRSFRLKGYRVYCRTRGNEKLTAANAENMRVHEKQGSMEQREETRSQWQWEIGCGKWRTKSRWFYARRRGCCCCCCRCHNISQTTRCRRFGLENFHILFFFGNFSFQPSLLMLCINIASCMRTIDNDAQSAQTTLSASDRQWIQYNDASIIPH